MQNFKVANFDPDCLFNLPWRCQGMRMSYFYTYDQKESNCVLHKSCKMNPVANPTAFEFTATTPAL
jgi:hypothetical protein